MPTLRIKLPDNKGEITHVLSGNRITVGRRPENTIQIIDPTISAHHAEFIQVNGHYRLHDLGSTNLTCVNEEPITDFHLHHKCKVNFGTVECQFALENPSREEVASEMVPTRAELEYLRRENLELVAKISRLEKELDILGCARLVTSDSKDPGLPSADQRRLAHERNEMRAKNANLQMEVANLKADVAELTRARQAMRQAWQTVKDELAAAQRGFTSPSGETPDPTAPPSTHLPTPAPQFDPESAPVLTSEAQKNGGDARPPDDHRALASLVMIAPALIKAIIRSLDELSSGKDDAALRRTLAADIAELHRQTSSLAGHPVERIAAAMHALMPRDASGEIPAPAVRTLQQGSNLFAQLLDPAQLKRARAFAKPSALVVDDDPDVIATVTLALQGAGIAASSCPDSEQALERLAGTSFDLILLDVGLPNLNGIEMCARIRGLELNKRSPIVFLTAADTLETRAQSSLNGGNDFIGKPFSSDELALKASTWALRNQFGLS